MAASDSLPSIDKCLPTHLDLYYDGGWHAPKSNNYRETYNPGNGEVIDRIADAGSEDVSAAVEAAHSAFQSWRTTPPMQRAGLLRKAADVLRQHAKELALLDALNTGNPVTEMLSDALVAAANLEYFAGLIPMLKGETIPQTDETFHYTLREPLGVVARIVAFNHPVMFAGAKLAAPLAAGNTVIIKPPDQAPLSCIRLAELLGPVFPKGVLGVLPGGVECGQSLSTHPLVRKITLIGSVGTGKAIARAAADSLKPTLFELGGKNALIALPDADLDQLVLGISRGMNFTWAGQSCGSTSRVFLHHSHHDEVLRRVAETVARDFVPGVPTDPRTTMGPLITRAAQERVRGYIRSAQDEGARLVTGGPDHQGGSTEIQNGFFVPPTIFSHVTPQMRIAREEIFGPVLSVFQPYTSLDEVLEIVNATPYGLTASVFTRDVSRAHHVVRKIEAGFVWVNGVGRHFLNVPFGGYKESGGGREECFEELLAFTQTKSVNVFLG